MKHHLRSAQVWHVFSTSQGISQFYLHTHTFIRNQNETYQPLPFLDIAATHLPTQEGWKAELAWVAGYVARQFTCPKAVTHPTTNRAQCRTTALIETNVRPVARIEIGSASCRERV